MIAKITSATFSRSAGLAIQYYSDGRIIGFQNDWQTRDEAIERIARHTAEQDDGTDYIASAPEEMADICANIHDFETIYTA